MNTQQEFSYKQWNCSWDEVNADRWHINAEFAKILQGIIIGYRRCGVSLLLAYTNSSTIEPEKRNAAKILLKIFARCFFGEQEFLADQEIVEKYSALSRAEYMEKEQLFIRTLDFGMVFIYSKIR